MSLVKQCNVCGTVCSPTTNPNLKFVKVFREADEFNEQFDFCENCNKKFDVLLMNIDPTKCTCSDCSWRRSNPLNQNRREYCEPMHRIVLDHSPICNSFSYDLNKK